MVCSVSVQYGAKCASLLRACQGVDLKYELLLHAHKPGLGQAGYS